MKSFINGLVVLSMIGCASTRYEDDKNNPAYHRGDYFPLQSGEAKPVASADGANAQIRAGVSGANSGVDTAVLGLVATGIVLANNRNYYRSNALTGKCICRNSENDTIQLPCTHLNVIVTDTKGKELARIQTQDGEFAFKVQEKLAYRLKIDSDRYSVPKKILERNFYRGDDIVLNLLRK